MDHEQETTSEAQDSPEDQREAAFEPALSASDDELSGVDANDDSDAPIRLEELAPDTAGTSPASVPVGPGTEPVRAESVTISQGGAQLVEASTVSITQGGAGRVSADELSVSQGGVGFARADSLTVQSEASAFAVVADSATVEEGASVFLLITRSLTGEVRPVLDWRAALALGGGFALALSILRRLR